MKLQGAWRHQPALPCKGGSQAPARRTELCKSFDAERSRLDLIPRPLHYPAKSVASLVLPKHRGPGSHSEAARFWYLKKQDSNGGS